MNQPQLGSFESTVEPNNRPEQDELRELELSFAYEHASGAIETHCLVAEAIEGEGDVDRPWIDLRTRDIDLADEVRYLQSRGLLETHPDRPGWVRICDEDEPLAAAEGLVQ